jgi:VWFA-related protein
MQSSYPFLVGGALFLAFLGMYRSPEPPVPGSPEPAPVAAAAPSGLMTIRKDVREVTLSFIVQDEDGRPVTSLRREQVRVLSDGSAVSNLNSFYDQHDLPLRLFVLVDTSDSVSPQFLAELKATDEFASRVARAKIDQVFWNGFAAGLDTYPENAGSVVRPAAFGRHGIGQTALYDAVYEIAARERSRPPVSTPNRRALILLSDGEDNWSRRSLEDAARAAQAAGIAIYAITVHDFHVAMPGDAALNQLSTSTGGRAFILSSYEHVAGAFAEIERELRSQYLVTFAPPRTCGMHHVQVSTSDPGYGVQSRNAYFVDGC